MKKFVVVNTPDGGRLKADVKVTVDSEGMFRTTLDEHFVDHLKKEYLVDDWEKNRAGREGFFKADTLKKLLTKIEEKMEQAVSLTLVDTKLMLHYQLVSTASFSLSKPNENGEKVVIPGPAYHGFGLEPEEGASWMKGSKMTYVGNAAPTSMIMAVMVINHKIYRMANGKEIVKKSRVFDNKIPKEYQDDPYIHYITSLRAHNFITSHWGNLTEKVQEMEYTQKAGEFFVSLHRAMCKVALVMGELSNDQDKLIEHMENGRKLLN